MEKNVHKFRLFDNEDHQMYYNTLTGRSIHSRDVVDWEFLSNNGREEWKGKCTFLSLDRELVYTPRGSPERLQHLHTIGDDGYNVGNTKAKSIRNPRIRLSHRCLTMTITGKKETTHRVTEIDLFYLYCIFEDGIVCNIPYWLAKYLKSVKEKSVIFGGMFETRMARSFGLLTNKLVSVLNREPPSHVYRKTSLIKMGVIMELHKGEYFWPATREVVGEGGGDDEGETKGLGASRTTTAT
ncbi:hypothetical protein Tco_0422467 [Tanacetum coccineum]